MSCNLGKLISSFRLGCSCVAVNLHNPSKVKAMADELRMRVKNFYMRIKGGE